MESTLSEKQRLVEAKIIIDALPFRSFLTDAQIDLWINHVNSNDPLRLVWHARRLSGFGGSEMGSLVASYLSDHGSDYIKPGFSFKSANEIVQSKLMMTMPGAIESNALRGLFFEEKIRELYIEQLRRKGHVVHRDVEGMNAINLFNDPDRVWRKANIDDLLIVDGKRRLVDYKFPAPDIADNYKNYGISSDYQCQGHHYADIAFDLDIQIDEACLAPYHMQLHEVYDLAYPIRQDIRAVCKDAGDFYWNEYLLKGKAPPFPRSWEVLFDPKALTTQQKSLSREFAIYKSMAKKIDDHVKAANKNLIETFESFQWKNNTKVEMGPVDCFVKKDKEFNEKNILDYFKRFGLNDKPFIKSTAIRYDLPAMYEALEQIDLPTEAKQLMLSTCAKDEITIAPALTRAKKSKGCEILDGIHEASENALSEVAGQLDEKLTKVESLWVQDSISKKAKTDQFLETKKKQKETQVNDISQSTPPNDVASHLSESNSNDSEQRIANLVQRLKMAF